MSKEDKIKDLLKREESTLDSMEHVPAPSGEYTDYNHDILVQEAVVATLQDVLHLLVEED